LTQIYDALDIKGLNERGESFYNPFLSGVIEDLEKQGLAVESEGATVVFLEGVSILFLNRTRLFGVDVYT
jgi:arginyl-tRNA synthetase